MSVPQTVNSGRHAIGNYRSNNFDSGDLPANNRPTYLRCHMRAGTGARPKAGRAVRLCI